MKGVEKTGRTVDEAIQSALAEIGLSRDEVDVKILEESNRRFFGLVAGRPARVCVTPKEDPLQRARRFLLEILKQMGINTDVDIENLDGAVRFEIRGHDLGLLIGRHGQTLDALQHLVNRVADRHARRLKLIEQEGEAGHLPIILDAENYRKRREESLRKLALRMADRVRREGRRAILEPMTALERRIIHTALQGINGVSSHSEGEEPYRRVVICPRS